MKKLLTEWRKFLKEEESVWYRGSTSNTKEAKFTWLAKDKSHAEKYRDMNKAIQGGEARLATYNLDLSGLKLTDLTGYDMDEYVDEFEAEDFLGDVGVSYDVEDIFDISEDSVPLSRVVNQVLPEIVAGTDGFKIMEDGALTLCIKTDLLISLLNASGRKSK